MKSRTDGWVPMRQRRHPRVEKIRTECCGGSGGGRFEWDPNRPALFTIFDGMGLKLESQETSRRYICNRKRRAADGELVMIRRGRLLLIFALGFYAQAQSPRASF